MGQEHLAGTEEITHHAHSIHERALDDKKRTSQLLPRLFRVGIDKIDDAFDQRVLKTLLHCSRAPSLLRLLFLGAPIPRRFQPFCKIHQSLGGIGAAIQQHILHHREELRFDLLVDLEHPRIHDRHIEASLDRMVEEGRVHRLTDGIIPTEGEGDITESSARLGTRKRCLDLTHRLNEVNGVVVVFLNAGRNREDIGIENDVLRIESNLVDKKSVGTATNPDFILLGGGLTLLVKGHDNDRRPVALGQASPLEKGLLTILEADGIQHTLALEALHPLLQHRPLGTVDHDRHTTDLGVGRKEVQEGHHDLLAVEHSFVDIHIEDIGPALDLLACHRKGRLIIPRNDQLREPRRSGDIRPLTNHHEGAPLLNSKRFETAQSSRRRRV